MNLKVIKITHHKPSLEPGRYEIVNPTDNLIDWIMRFADDGYIMSIDRKDVSRSKVYNLDTGDVYYRMKNTGITGIVIFKPIKEFRGCIHFTEPIHLTYEDWKTRGYIQFE